MGYTQCTETHKWSENMHRITINVPESIFQRARIKALRENVAVSEVIRDLLVRWVAGEIEPASKERSREKLVDLARAARGMWADRDLDSYLVKAEEKAKVLIQ
jgi:predicted DCC family thiol-disulfide oxidoreductase YuxK